MRRWSGNDATGPGIVERVEYDRRLPRRTNWWNCAGLPARRFYSATRDEETACSSLA